MFKSLGIQNFQGHQNTFVEFSRGLNVIAGSSDSGKSAILRSILWVIKNRPLGDAVKNWKSGKKDSVVVELVMENPANGQEESIIKEKTPKTVFYTLSNQPEPLSVIGRDVPKEVIDMVNFSELNFRGQHEPYLLAITPGALAKMINDLVGLSVIDVSFKNLNSQSTRLKSSCESIVKTIEEKDQGIQALYYLPAMESDIKNIETLQSKLTINTQKQSELSKIIADVIAIQEEALHNNTILVLGGKANDIQSLVTTYQSQTQKIDTLRQNIEGIISTQTLAKENNKLLQMRIPAKEISDLIGEAQTGAQALVDLKSLVGSIESISSDLENSRAWLEVRSPAQEIMDLIDRFSVGKIKHSQLDKECRTIVELKRQLNVASYASNNSQKALTAFLEEAKICPTCQRPFDQQTIKGMVHLQ